MMSDDLRQRDRERDPGYLCLPPAPTPCQPRPWWARPASASAPSSGRCRGRASPGRRSSRRSQYGAGGKYIRPVCRPDPLRTLYLILLHQHFKVYFVSVHSKAFDGFQMSVVICLQWDQVYCWISGLDWAGVTWSKAT